MHDTNEITDGQGRAISVVWYENKCKMNEVIRSCEYIFQVSYNIM